MEREVWTRILAHLYATRKEVQGRRFVYAIDDIVRVFLWAALHERPIYWACCRRHWPDDLCPPRLPTPSTMTRRLRTPAVQSTLQAVERRSRGRWPRSLLQMVDGKPLPIGYHSRDADAGYGRGAGQMAKDYKLHMIAGAMGNIRAWCVRPIHHDEAKVAAQLPPQAIFRATCWATPTTIAMRSTRHVGDEAFNFWRHVVTGRDAVWAVTTTIRDDCVRSSCWSTRTQASARD